MGRKGVEVREKSLRVLFTYDGKLHRPTLMRDGEALPPTPANQKFAHRLVAEIRERIRHGTFVMADYFSVAGTGVGGTSLTDVVDTWLAAQRVTDSTKAGYESAIRFWKAALDGDRAVRSVKHSEILTALANRPELSGKTVNNYVSVLREAFALAVIDKVVETSPVDGVPRAKYQKPEADPFSLEEAEAIIAYSAKHHPPPVHNLIEHWFFAGYRTSEIAGLKWPSVDFRRDEVKVHEALVRGKEKAKTKTDVARLIKLNSRALAALKRQ
jgi:integrase